MFVCKHEACDFIDKNCVKRCHVSRRVLTQFLSIKSQNKKLHTCNLPCIQCRQQPDDEHFLPPTEQFEEQQEEQQEEQDQNEFQMYKRLSVEERLSLKDTLAISDNGWKKIETAFNLPKDCRIFNLKRYRKSVPMQTKKISGGYCFDVLDMIATAIKLENIPPKSNLEIKLALDAGQPIKNKKKLAEIVTIDVIKNNNISKLTSTCKSFKNSYMIAIYQTIDHKDPETNDNLDQYLAMTFAQVNQLIQNKNIIINNNEYTVNFVLCCDMKALVSLTGLKSVYNHKCTYRCIWCAITKEEMG